MRVTDLLQLEALHLTLRWGGELLLDRDIAGVTVTDQLDPAPFVHQGDVVLSGLVWWTERGGRAKADRFVSALREARAVALLAGEATHGRVPEAIVDACRASSVPVVAVPARTNFRAVTDAVYLRHWGGLDPTAGQALPAPVRRELDRLLAENAPLDTVLATACAPLGDLPCHVVTSTGRTVARTAAAEVAPARMAATVRRRGATTLRIDTGATPYDTWYLHVPAAAETPPSALRELAGVVARHRLNATREHPERAAKRLVAAVAGPGRATQAALRKCDLPSAGPYSVYSLTLDDPDTAVVILGELLALRSPAPFAVAALPHGEVVAVHAHPDPATSEQLAALHACAPEAPLPVGVSTPVATADELHDGLALARHAAQAGVSDSGELTTLAVLISGLPEAVRTAYRTQVLGSLLDPVLLETLETFLAHDGSWTRAARSLHVHVNTVHYRIQRVEQLTGRDLSRLDHRLDLGAALLCR